MTPYRKDQTLATTMRAIFMSLGRALGLPLSAWFAFPIHALPAELFLDILMATLDFGRRLVPQLHRLAQVCKYWLRSILSNSRFWIVIDLHDMHLAPMVVKKNPDGPLNVRCRAGSEIPIDKFLEAARGQSHRWDSLELAGYLDERDVRLLNNPTPVLVTLNVENYHFSETIPFPLSPTITTLRHVQVTSIHLPWNSPSLVGLKSISLSEIYSGAPSLCQIIAILTASPALEWFGLRNITGFPTSTDDVEVAKQIISLPALRGLYLLLGPTSSIAQRLLKTIDTPKCRVLETYIPYHFLQNPGSIFEKLISISMAGASRIQVYYWGVEMTVIIGSTMLTRPYRHFHDGWRYEGEAHIDLSIEGVPYPSNAGAQLISVLGLHHVNQMEVQLYLYSRGGTVDSVHLFGNHPVSWDSATKLHLYGMGDAIHDLRFLANPVVENGLAWWSCPRLTYIKLVDPVGTAGKEVADAVLEFLEKRSVDRYPWRDVSITWDTPAQLECIEADEAIIMFLRGTKFVEEVELKAHPRQL